METILPLILVGLGSAAMVILRNGLLVLGGLLLQWVGLIIAAWLLGAGQALGAMAAEVVTALVCVSILAMTLVSLDEASRTAISTRRTRPPTAAPASVEERARGLTATPDDLWPVVVLVAAAIAGLVLARLYPLGGGEGVMVAFYWTVLAGVLVMVLEGARDPVKLAAGLLALINGVGFLLETLSGGAPEPVSIGLLSACRIALAIVLAYGWTLLHAHYSTLSLSALFSARDLVTSTAVTSEAELQVDPALPEVEGREVGEESVTVETSANNHSEP